MDQTQSPQSTVVRFRCAPVIKAALQFAAKDQMITSSAYVRRAVARSLQADGAVIPVLLSTGVKVGSLFADC